MKIKLTTNDAPKIIASLKAKSLKGKVQVEGKVVYDAEHAIFVHEDLEAEHPNGGQAKYLEQPAREYHRKYMDIVTSSIKNKNGLEEGVQRALNALLEDSLPLVPVDTGELYESGHVEMGEVTKVQA